MTIGIINPNDYSDPNYQWQKKTLGIDNGITVWELTNTSQRIRITGDINRTYVFCWDVYGHSEIIVIAERHIAEPLDAINKWNNLKSFI
jgi:hypothetical protein